MMLVSLEQAKLRLRASDHEDPDLMMMIQQASDMVLTYIKKDEDDFEEVPHAIQVATLLIVGELMKEREAGSDPMSKGVIDILTPYREPTLA